MNQQAVKVETDMEHVEIIPRAAKGDDTTPKIRWDLPAVECDGFLDRGDSLNNSQFPDCFIFKIRADCSQ